MLCSGLYIPPAKGMFHTHTNKDRRPKDVIYNPMKRLLKFSQFLNEALEPVDHKGPLYHLSNYTNRQSIQTNGLKPGIGQKTTNWQKGNKTQDLQNFVYVLDHEPRMLEKSMFGFDVWEINPEGLDLKLFYDPNHDEFGGWLVTTSEIPASSLKLIDKNEKYDDCMLGKSNGEHCKDLDPDNLLA
jgi:hypothetical protein